MRIIVNTISTKKYSGGAFQIVNNFLVESLKHQDELEWYYFTSVDVDEVVGNQFVELKDVRYFVFPTQPDFFGTYIKVKHEVAKLENYICPDVIYSITAPSYFTFATVEVMRFTNPLVAHPNKYSNSVLTLFQKTRNWFYCKNQIRMIRKAHYFVTQTETTKNGILKITGEQDNHVCVVKNVLPSVFKSMDNTPIIEDDWINIACVGNPVPHKNFDIIPSVLIELRKLGINNVRFHTTIPNDHSLYEKIKYELVKSELIDGWVNHGRLSQIELGFMYQRCQFCFLPTLLEVFSASTVEAMYFNLPTIATDLPFNKEVFQDSCLYYIPMDAKDAALKFQALVNDKKNQEFLKVKMQERLKLFDDYENHFNSIKDFLIKVAKNKL